MSIVSFFGLEQKKPWYSKLFDWVTPGFYTAFVENLVLYIIIGAIILIWVAIPILKRIKVG